MEKTIIKINQRKRYGRYVLPLVLAFAVAQGIVHATDRAVDGPVAGKKPLSYSEQVNQCFQGKNPNTQLCKEIKSETVSYNNLGVN